MSDSSQALIPSQGEYPIEFAINAWLDAKRALHQSAETFDAYESTIKRFRGELQSRGYDLTSSPREVEVIAQHWSQLPWRADRKAVSTATRNQRLAILSSFYDYTRKHRHLTVTNPIEDIQRGKVQRFAKARPLTIETIERGMQAIDRSTLAGARDYAILAVGFYTGMRLSSMASLEMRSLTISGQTISVTFVAKGDKTFTRTLPRETSGALARYLSRAYAVTNIRTIRPDTPVWLSFAPNNYRGRLGADGIRDVLVRHFGVSKFHTTRHSVAKQMYDLGASTRQIQAWLGHANVATTEEYLEQLSSDENPYAEALERSFGITSGEEDE